MQPDALRETISAILRHPTASFREDAVRAEILQRLSACPHVTCEVDGSGNIIARYQRGDALPRFALAAHMDHPAYVKGEFLGGVPERYFAVPQPVREVGDFSIWDLPDCEWRDDRVYSRACDDLIGCSCIVAAFEELEKTQAAAACYGLFTVAEEVGFVGAIELAQSGRVPREVCIVSLETSSERGGPGRMGDGVIVRVGDRSSIFDSEATALLLALARAAEIPAQRCLMAGGSCEATAYQLYGYRTAGICVALGNYHNCGPDDRIAVEYVSEADALGMARLCVEIAQTAVPFWKGSSALRTRLETDAAEWRKKHPRPDNPSSP